jgi:hypothetical protein
LGEHAEIDGCRSGARSRQVAITVWAEDQALAVTNSKAAAKAAQKRKTQVIKAIVPRSVSDGAKRTQKSIRARIAAFAFAAVGAVALIIPASSSAQAAGVVNCVDLLVQADRAGACWESVWVNGTERRMVFPQEAQGFPGTIQSDRLGPFYVIAPQTAVPQGALPFQHDHTVADSNFTKLHGYLVFCSAAGITSGSCVPATGGFPLAKTVNGQSLTTVGAIESGLNAGLLTLLDTQATFAAHITGN